MKIEVLDERLILAPLVLSGVLLSQRPTGSVVGYNTVPGERGPKMRNRGVVASFIVAVVVLGCSSLAWACGPSGSIEGDYRPGAAGISPSSGSSGSTVTVSGRNFPTGEVALLWNSLTGERLDKPGSAKGPNFEVQVVIPQADPGVYYINAVQYSSTGAVRGQSRAAFEVTARQNASTDTNEGGTGDSTGGQTSASDDSGESSQQPASSSSGGSTQRSGSGASAPAPSASSGAQPAEQHAPSSAHPETVPSSANAPVVPTASGRVVFGNSLPASPVTADGTPVVAGEFVEPLAATGAGPSNLVGSSLTTGPSFRAQAIGSRGAADAGLQNMAMLLLIAGGMIVFGSFVAAELRRKTLATRS